MLGINNDKIEFSDIKMGFVRPPKDAAMGAGGAGGAGGAEGEAAGGIKADDEEVDEMSIEDDEDIDPLLNGEDKSKICASQTTCASHEAWCAQT